MSPEEPQVFKSFVEVLDYKPAFSVIALFAPVGLPSKPMARGRHCDRAARALLGRPRSSAIVSAPVRGALAASSFADAAEANGGHLSPISWRLFRRYAEVDQLIAPYWQRTLFEVHPELSFYQLNDDQSVRYPKRSQAGRDERRALLEAKFRGVERILATRLPRVSETHMIDAAACLWTARRIVSRAVNRLPEDPEWDDLGLRMELLR